MEFKIKINNLKTYTLSLGFIIGKWENDDVELTPTIKFRTGSKENFNKYNRVTFLALCWLKYGIVLKFKKSLIINNEDIK